MRDCLETKTSGFALKEKKILYHVFESEYSENYTKFGKLSRCRICRHLNNYTFTLLAAYKIFPRICDTFRRHMETSHSNSKRVVCIIIERE